MDRSHHQLMGNTFDPSIPAAVFLGPSLPVADARKLLTANYFPPARMGSIYRLLSSGVRTIVIIDGVFHGEAAVWHREILDAIESGIHVVGGASMGALRAAELDACGMVGVGRIYRLFAKGCIDGDDEVALLHADQDFAYRPISEPLINIRHNLERAVRRNIVSSKQALEMTQAMKLLWFGDRSIAALFASKPFRALAKNQAQQLSWLFNQQWIDLKRIDAIKSLARAAMAPVQPFAGPIDFRRNRYYHRHRGQHELFVDRHGQLQSLSGKILPAKSLSDEQKRDLQKGWFLRDWLVRQMKIPAADQPLNDQALRGLCERAWSEFGPVGECYALIERFFLETLPDAHQRDIRQKLVETWILVNWANANGVVSPDTFNLDFKTTWLAGQGISDLPMWCENWNMNASKFETLLGDWALARWLIEHGPVYFGVLDWSLEAEQIRQLRANSQSLPQDGVAN